MSEWQDCPFCGGKGPFTESTNHRLGCPHGDLIDESIQLREACEAVLDWFNKDRPWPRLAIVRDGLRDALKCWAEPVKIEGGPLLAEGAKEKP